MDQNRTAELTAKINETLVPQLNELPGFAGYYFVDVGNGIFTWPGFETPTGEESTKLVATWIQYEKLDRLMPNEPKITSGKGFARTASASWSRSQLHPMSTKRARPAGPFFVQRRLSRRAKGHTPGPACPRLTSLGGPPAPGSVDR